MAMGERIFLITAKRPPNEGRYVKIWKGEKKWSIMSEIPHIDMKVSKWGKHLHREWTAIQFSCRSQQLQPLTRHWMAAGGYANGLELNWMRIVINMEWYLWMYNSYLGAPKTILTHKISCLCCLILTSIHIFSWRILYTPRKLTKLHYANLSPGSYKPHWCSLRPLPTPRWGRPRRRRNATVRCAGSKISATDW